MHINVRYFYPIYAQLAIFALMYLLFIYILFLNGKIVLFANVAGSFEFVGYFLIGFMWSSINPSNKPRAECRFELPTILSFAHVKGLVCYVTTWSPIGSNRLIKSKNLFKSKLESIEKTYSICKSNKKINSILKNGPKTKADFVS
ncbi:hypothetical protein BpHYR1_016899 [Brachionus plicatilis]|uniref:Uncharacterized protein n=1 Tax=Brachionus plicatilis TaxID=10195 RepID=A0A3M7RGC5_BRAPC|nr:hypothetical protein BpHYR1_016899 [Brachionus plicatilis]